MGRAVVIAYLDFSKMFDIVFHSLLLGKMARYRLDGWLVKWYFHCCSNESNLDPGLHAQGHC